MMETTTQMDTIASRLGITGAHRRGALVRRILWWAAIAAIVAGVAVVARQHARPAPPHYRTEPVSFRSITVTINATGKLQPTHQIEVGSEQSGIVKSVEVDNNDRVVAGQVLARIDPTKLEAQTKQVTASLGAAQARLLQAGATLDEATAQLARLERVHDESNGRVPAQYELDSQRAAVKRARADRASAQASVDQAVATLDTYKTDLSKLVIRSPISGLVLSRAIDPGQTVAAAFQTPVLFTIAENLTQMELALDVDEADIGSVNAGQDATFTVDAYPDRTFKAKVLEVRFAPQTVNGVVTYKTVLRVDNSDLALRPGMTANADLVVRQLAHVLSVPSAALRIALGDASAPGPRVWTLQGDRPVAVPVTTGAADGTNTEIRSGQLADGQPVVVDTGAR